MAGPSYFEQLKTYLASAASQEGAPLSLVNPDNSEQVVEISLQSLPERPDGWPVGLPEPIRFENEHAAGMAFVTGNDGEAYMLFRDPETGQPIAMSHEDIIHLSDSLIKPIIEDARADTRGYDPYRDEFLPSKDVYSADLVALEGGASDGQVLRQAVLKADGTIDRFGGNHVGAEIVLVDPSLREGDTPQSPVLTRDAAVAGGAQLNNVLIQGKGDVENAVLLAQLREYSVQLGDAVDRDNSTGVNFGAGIPVASISAGGVIEMRQYDERPAPVQDVKVEPESVEVTGAQYDRAGETVGVVIEGPEEDLIEGPQDVVPEATAGFVLANEVYGLSATPVAAIEEGGFYNEGKGLRVLEAMRRNMGTPPDPEKVADYFDGRDEYKQIEESWRPIAAAYVMESVQTGYAPPLGDDSKFRLALEALEEGRVEDAQTLLDGGTVEVTNDVKVEELDTGAAVEAEVYSPGRVDPPLETIEPAAGDGLDADEMALRAKVEATTAEIEGLLNVAAEDGSGPVYDIVVAMQTKAAIAAVRTNFADAVAENGTIDIDKLPVSSDFGDDFTADEELRQLAERLNGLHEQYSSMDIEQRARDVIEFGPN